MKKTDYIRKNKDRERERLEKEYEDDGLVEAYERGKG